MEVNGSRAVAGVLIFALVISGCLNQSSEGEGDDSLVPEGDEENNDGAGAEANATVANEYWANSTHDVVYEGSHDLIHYDASGGSASAESFLLPDEKLVFPGTEWLNVTYEISGTWSGQVLPVGKIELVYEAANGERGEITLEDEGTITIEVDEEMNDLPLSPVSLWGFRIGLGGAGSVQVDLEISVNRSPGPLPEWDPPPEYWSNMTSLLRYEHSGPLSGVDLIILPAAIGDHPNETLEGLQPIPPETDRVLVEMWYNSSSDPDLHYTPLLRWSGADKPHGDNEETERQPDEYRRQSENGYLLWELDVEPRMWDTPYALSSVWEIIIQWNGDPFEPISVLEGDFDLTVTASRHSD